MGIHSRKRVYYILNKITKKPKPPPQSLTTDESGKLLESAEQSAQMWFRFLRDKFKQTDQEVNRPEMDDIPSYRSPNSVLTRREFDTAVACMKNNKAVGPDGIPAEAIKYSSAVKDTLFEIVEAIWEQETLSEGFAQAKFVMIYKNKGSSNDPSNYRCIALLNHAYKILSRIILMRLTGNGENYLPDWQAGFRKNRGCRDNIFIMRTLFEKMMQLGRSLTVSYIDYSASFDTVSHKFLDKALADAGASNKVRAMFRAIYRSASAFTVVKGTDHKGVKSDVFPILRGVLQGDILSPLFFILALTLILKRHG